MSNNEIKTDLINNSQRKVVQKGFVLTAKAKLLMQKYDEFCDLNEAIKAVIFIEDGNNYSLEEFEKLLKTEKIDQSIQERIAHIRGYGNAYKNSIKGKDKEIKEEEKVEFKVRKKSILKKTLITIITVVGIVISIYVINEGIEYFINKNATETIEDDTQTIKYDVKLIDEDLPPNIEYDINPEYKEKTTIIDNNSKLLGFYYEAEENGQREKDIYPNIAFHYDDMAENILELEAQNTMPFEMSLYDLFKEFRGSNTITALQQMDKIIEELKMLTKENPEYARIYDKIRSKSCFLEVLLSVSDYDYDENMFWINEYKKNGHNLDEKTLGNIEFILDQNLEMFANSSGGRK